MNKIVVITGASSGIGKKTAELYESRKDTVINISLNVEEINKLNYKCDVSNEIEVENVFKKIKLDFPKIDIVINCAGYGISGATELITTSAAKKLFDVNVFGVFNVTKQALPLMEKGGKIINIASAMALFPLPFRAMYASSKAAVLMMSEAQRMECLPFGVQISTVCPGDVKTNFTKNRVKDFTTNERYGQRISRAAGDLDSKEEKRMLPIVVAKTIVKLSYKKNMKPMKIVGTKYKVLYFFSKLFPKSLLLRVTAKFYGGGKK